MTSATRFCFSIGAVVAVALTQGCDQAVGPTGSFTVDLLSGPAPLTVRFTDSSVPGDEPITSWAWNFDDPDSEVDNTSTEPEPRF